MPRTKYESAEKKAEKCPFCKQKKLTVERVWIHIRVVCDNCLACGPVVLAGDLPIGEGGKEYERAFEAWNRRGRG